MAARSGPCARRRRAADPAALSVMYERHHQALYRYCRSILQDDEDARDALQSTMAKALAASATSSATSSAPWLFRIAHNEAISGCAARRRGGTRCRGTLGTTVAQTLGTASAWRCCASTSRPARAPAPGARATRAQRALARGDR